MIRLNDISKTYTGKSGETKALDNVSLEFEDRGLVFIVGKSGSGKTTLLNILGGIDTPTDGEMIVDGFSFRDYKKKDLDIYRNYHVGFVFQEYYLLSHYNVGKNVSLAVELQGNRSSRERVEELLRSVELTDLNGKTLYDRKISELSGGQKQRVAIARALIKNPDIILADEPTGALDSTTGMQLYDLLKKLSRDKLIVVVSHDEESAEVYGDRIIHLEDGKVIGDTILSQTSLSHTSDFEAEYDSSESNVSKNLDGEPADESGSESEMKQGRRSEDEDKICAAQPVSVNNLGHRGLLWTTCIAMGGAGFRHKTVRLVITLILAVCFLMIVGFSVTAATADASDADLKRAYSAGEQTAFIVGDSYLKYFNGVYIHKTEITYLESEQLQTLENYMPLMMVLNGFNINSYYSEYEAGQIPREVEGNPYNYFGMIRIPLFRGSI